MDISGLRERKTNVFTVSELNGYIKNILDSDRTLSCVTVKGEISNLVLHRSGHIYLSLKDDSGYIKCVMFRSSAVNLKFRLEDGMKVTAYGQVSVYQQTGSYQLYITSIQPDGIGALYMAYEQLRERLLEEGLFADENKKPIPPYPEKIGVITSPTGAAVRDIINVITRRYPIAAIYVYPSLVQGEGAPENLIEALDYFEKSHLADTIIIGRGGGSIEDLWAFNNEALARKIHSMTIPVISAVGHETDFTIADFVADLRAPTPSAAAELAVPDIREITMRLLTYEDRISASLTMGVERRREKLEFLSKKDVFVSEEYLFSKKRESLLKLYERLSSSIDSAISERKQKLTVDTEKANALSPLAVLSRGYAIARKEKCTVRSVSDINTGDNIKVILKDGEISASVNEITKMKGEK